MVHVKSPELSISDGFHLSSRQLHPYARTCASCAPVQSPEWSLSYTRGWHGAAMDETLCKSGIAFFPLKKQKSLDPLVALPSAL